MELEQISTPSSGKLPQTSIKKDWKKILPFICTYLYLFFMRWKHLWSLYFMNFYLNRKSKDARIPCRGGGRFKNLEEAFTNRVSIFASVLFFISAHLATPIPTPLPCIEILLSLRKKSLSFRNDLVNATWTQPGIILSRYKYEIPVKLRWNLEKWI